MSGNGRRLSKDDRAARMAEAIRLRREGVTGDVTAERLGVCPSTIWTWTKGVDSGRAERERQRIADCAATARRLRHCGLTYDAIAAQMGVDSSTVSRWLR